jgi:2-polyprenyl-3-methyl-5-hydroxy-6-metoxy-1,4-benzoquinol methylase
MFATERCRFCGAGSEPAFAAFDRNQRVSSDLFRYDRCAQCGTIFLAKPPSDLGRYYPPTYYPPLPARDELDRTACKHRWRVDLLRAYVPSGRLIEVGPGPGLFAHLAKSAGYDVIAIEMDPRCCEYLRDVVGVEVVETDDAVAALERIDGADAIALWHVLEHVERPAELLASAAKALVPGGALIVATPNVDSLQFRLLGARWPHVDAPRHLALIPLGALDAQAVELGLQRVAVTAADPAGEYDAFGWQGALPGRARGYSAHFAGRLIRAFATPFERRNLNASAYTAVLRKA